MAREISLSKRLKIVEFVPSCPGSTRAFCRRMGVSLRSFYRIRSRWSGSGTSSLHPASRAPRRPHRRYGPDAEAAVAALHAELTARGLDAGGITIRFHLQQRGMDPLPSVSTINRILARNGLSRVQRAKRPRSSYTRFARSRTCELWQLDAFEVALTGGDRATVYQIIDDASRLCIALTARTRAENPADAIDVLTRAIAAHGRPVAVLTDNGAAFNTHRRGLLSSTELYLASLGVAPISGRAGHPQTQGKTERSHHPARKWLAAHPATTLTDLQIVLNEFRDVYNNHRPHQAFSPVCTPAAAWARMSRAPEPTAPIDPDDLLAAPEHTTRTVRSRGVLSYQGHTLYLGTQWAGEPIRLTHAPGRLTLTHPTTERHLTTITWPPPTPYTNLTDHCQKS